MSPSFAWTPGQGSYKHYPPYVNLTGNRLAVRGPEKLDGEHPMPGDYVAVELPPEALDELCAALDTRPTTVVTDEVVERVWLSLAQFQSRDGTWLQIGKRDFDATLASMPTVVTGEQQLQSAGGAAAVPRVDDDGNKIEPSYRRIGQ